jgi:hypothetical protein
VQVLGRIEPEKILGAIVDRQEMVGPVSAMLTGLPVIIDLDCYP